MLKRATGRPRSRKIKGAEEGGKATGRQMQCKRCGQFGHMMKTCNETVYDNDAPPPALPKPKTKKNKKAKAASIASTKQSQAGACYITITAPPLLSKSLAVNTKSKRGRRKKTSVGEGVTGYGRLFFLISTTGDWVGFNEVGKPGVKSTNANIFSL